MDSLFQSEDSKFDSSTNSKGNDRAAKLISMHQLPRDALPNIALQYLSASLESAW